MNKIYKKAKEILLKNPWQDFENDKELFNKPFFFEGNNGKAVLLVHGWTSVPYELKRLGEYLNAFGYTVSIPMLKGHGTVPRDLKDIKWEDWFSQIDEEYSGLRDKYEKVYVGGTSIGACLSIVLGQKHSRIPALILMATPFRLRFERLSVIFAEAWSKVKDYNKKFYPPTFGARETITRLISYQSYPIKSTLEVFRLIKTVREVASLVNSPALVMQSMSDHIVTKNSLNELCDNLGSKKKKKKSIKKAYHTFISDIKNEGVFEDILDFIEKN